MPSLDGIWFYRSFRPENATRGAAESQIVPWAPQGQLDVKTDPATGKVTGTLKFAPGVQLTVSGTVTPASGNLPDGIDLTGEGLSAVYHIRGFFIYSVGITIVGSVVAVHNDLAKQPDGTIGPFVLYPPIG